MINKITLEHIKSKIKSHTFTKLPSGKVLICEITLENGFTVRGEAAVVDPANYVQVMGEEIAYKDAIDKIWQLEGYLLQQKIYES